MERKKQILAFLFILLGLFSLECALTPFFSYLSSQVALGVYIVTPLSRLLAVAAPFFMLGTAASEGQRRGFSYGLIYLGIYTALSLLSRVPLSLITYDPIASSAPYWVSLLFYMLSALLTALILLASLFLGKLLFLGKEASVHRYDRFWSLGSAPSRVTALCASMLTLYLLVSEIIDFVSYAKDRLFVLSGADIFDLIFFVLCILLSGFAAFVIGRVAEKRLIARKTFNSSTK